MGYLVIGCVIQDGTLMIHLMRLSQSYLCYRSSLFGLTTDSLDQ